MASSAPAAPGDEASGESVPLVAERFLRNTGTTDETTLTAVDSAAFRGFSAAPPALLCRPGDSGTSPSLGATGSDDIGRALEPLLETDVP